MTTIVGNQFNTSKPVIFSKGPAVQPSLKPVTIKDLAKVPYYQTGKVTLSEAFSLIKTGFIQKAKGLYDKITKSPIKVCEAIGAIAGALAALPLVGISAVTGAAGIALGFAAFSAAKTIVNASKAIKHNSSGNYDAARKDLENMGASAFYLVIALPFMPKALKDISNLALNTSKIGLNQKMIANIKSADGVFGKVKAFFKGQAHKELL